MVGAGEFLRQMRRPPAPGCERPRLQCSLRPRLHPRRLCLINPLPQPASQGSSVIVKVLVGFLVFILLIVLAVMGSCVYIGYRAKKKADEISQAYKSNDLNKLAGALGAGSSKRRFRVRRPEAAALPIRRRFLFLPGLSFRLRFRK